MYTLIYICVISSTYQVIMLQKYHINKHTLAEKRDKHIHSYTTRSYSLLFMVHSQCAIEIFPVLTCFLVMIFLLPLFTKKNNSALFSCYHLINVLLFLSISSKTDRKTRQTGMYKQSVPWACKQDTGLLWVPLSHSLMDFPIILRKMKALL